MRRAASCMLAALTLASGARADEIARDDFAYAMPLQVDAAAALHRFAVPLQVYQHTLRTDLGDLRLLNAAGEVVPYALRAPAGDEAQERAAVRLPLFPLRGDPARATRALQLTIRAGDSSIDVIGNGPDVSGVPVTAYLLDARAMSVPVKALTVQWPFGTQDFSVAVKVESSADLNAWNTVLAAAPLANLQFAGQRLVQNRIEFAPVQAKFLRLSWPGQTAAAPLEEILAQPSDTRVEPARLVLRSPGRPDRDRAGEFLFDLGAHVPVDRVQLELPQLNTVANVELFARGSAESPWTRIVESVAYRLADASGEVASPAIAVSRTQARLWRLRVEQGGGGLGSGAPQLRVQWVPHDIIFAARGAGPFELVYGSSEARPAASPLAGFASAQDANRALQAAQATVGEEHLAGGVERLRAPKQGVPWRTIALWAVLILAVAVLAWMAWRLSRQMSA